MKNFDNKEFNIMFQDICKNIVLLHDNYLSAEQVKKMNVALKHIGNRVNLCDAINNTSKGNHYPTYEDNENEEDI